MRKLLLSLAAVLLAVDGYVHGLWTSRWQISHELEQAAARLSAIPMSLGDWQGTARELSPRQVEVAGFTAYMLRRYQRRQDDRVVDVLLACGTPGPLSVHTPEVCFVGAGFERTAAPRHEFLRPKGVGGPAEFWKEQYEKKQVLAPLRVGVLWSWHARDGWQTPENPRWAFAGLPVIHKLYVTCPLSDSREGQDDAVCAEFMNALLPQLDEALYSVR